jgi:hypothetical protein
VFCFTSSLDQESRTRDYNRFMLVADLQSHMCRVCSCLHVWSAFFSLRISIARLNNHWECASVNSTYYSPQNKAIKCEKTFVVDTHSPVVRTIPCLKSEETANRRKSCLSRARSTFKLSLAHLTSYSFQQSVCRVFDESVEWIRSSHRVSTKSATFPFHWTYRSHDLKYWFRRAR